MQPPAITRQRRPFLAPLWLTLVVVLVTGGVAMTFYRSATTTVVLLVRAVEKEPGTIEDPPLSPEGEQRGQHLAQMFGDANGSGRLDAIYVSDERRAQQTAAALAQRLHQVPVVFSAGDARAAAARVLREHPGGTVLVIGSGATLPQMIHELQGVDVIPAAQGESDILYMVSIPSFGRAHLVRIRF
ncbi:MAG TPA: histidine phosphatase family protein [Steroidobacteraceae bacterium]